MNGGKKMSLNRTSICAKIVMSKDRQNVRFLSFDGNLLTYQGKALGASWVLFLVHGKANGLYIVRRRRMIFFRLEKHEKIWNPVQGK